MFKWLDEWFEIRYKYRQLEQTVKSLELQEEKVCESCETLRQQLEIANYEKKLLLERLLEKPSSEPRGIEAPQMVTRPGVIPWKVRQQMLEREDRAAARSKANAAKPDIGELEKELDSAEKVSEARTGQESA